MFFLFNVYKRFVFFSLFKMFLTFLFHLQRFLTSVIESWPRKAILKYMGLYISQKSLF